jgi:hypothetical protein
MFSARPGQDFLRDRYELLVTVGRTPSGFYHGYTHVRMLRDNFDALI